MGAAQLKLSELYQITRIAKISMAKSALSSLVLQERSTLSTNMLHSNMKLED